MHEIDQISDSEAKDSDDKNENTPTKGANISRITLCLRCLVQACTSLYKAKKTGRKKVRQPTLFRGKSVLKSSYGATNKLTRLRQMTSQTYAIATANSATDEKDRY